MFDTRPSADRNCDTPAVRAGVEQPLTKALIRCYARGRPTSDTRVSRVDFRKAASHDVVTLRNRWTKAAGISDLAASTVSPTAPLTTPPARPTARQTATRPGHCRPALRMASMLPTAPASSSPSRPPMSVRPPYLLNCCTNRCTMPDRNNPKHTETAAHRPIFHNNIRKVGSFRNRQVIGSSPIVGSTSTPCR